MVILDQDDLRSMVRDIFAKDIKPDILAAVFSKKAESEKAKEGLKTRAEIAKHYRISLVTLGKHDRSGLPSIKVGKRRLYELDKVEQYFREIK
jgi:hypothetical protein